MRAPSQTQLRSHTDTIFALCCIDLRVKSKTDVKSAELHVKPWDVEPICLRESRASVSYFLLTSQKLSAMSSNGADIDKDDGDEKGGNVREQDRFLPIANISRIMKKALPANAKIAKDAKETVQECVSEFISFITSE